MAYSKYYPAHVAVRRPAYRYNAVRRWATHARPAYGYRAAAPRYGTNYRWPYGARVGLPAYRLSDQYAGYRYTGIPRWSIGRRWPSAYYSYAYTPPPSTYEPQSTASAPAAGVESVRPGAQWVYWAQSCLAQTVGSWVPQTGRIGAGTRRAIRMFQSQQQLPATGLLDNTTVNALRAACSAQAAAAQASPPALAVPAAMDDAAAAIAAASAAPPPEAAAPPPEAAPPEAAPPPEEAVSGEWEWPGRRRFWRRIRPRRFASYSQPDTGEDNGDAAFDGDNALSRRFGGRWFSYGRRRR